MPTTFRCGACNTTWSPGREPTECPKCGSRVIEPWGHSGATIDDPYSPPQASLSARSPVRSTAFSILYWLGWVGFVVGVAISVTSSAQEDTSLGVVGGLAIMAAMVCLLAAYIVSLVKIYRGWDAIQPLRRIDREESEMTTPGKAVGFLFIPIYGLYWNFVAIHGLTTRANKYMSRSGIKAKPMGEGLAKTYCILIVCSIIPFVGILLALINMFIYYFFILDVDRMRGAILTGPVGGSKVGYIDDLEAL